MPSLLATAWSPLTDPHIKPFKTARGKGPNKTVLRKIFDFTGSDISDEQITEAVEFAAYENMKKMEQERHFKGSGARVKPGDKDNPQSFKVRKAKVGGYRDYFTDEQCADLDAMVAQLDPQFGYAESQESAA